jgi:hypothetical protein
MSNAEMIARRSGLRFGAAVTLLVIVLAASVPGGWLAENRYGVDKVVASNTCWVIFIVVYAAILALPWLNLRGQEHLSRAQRLEKMCLAWLCLTIAPHLTVELPWVLFYHAIMAGKGQMWAYEWWSYADGGDMRYITRDVYLLAMETGASIIGITAGIILLRWRKTRRFSTAQLLVLMALMVSDFYPTYLYYATEIYRGFPSVGSISDLLIKFIGANIFWLFMPWVVFIWAGRQLTGRRAS